MILAVTNADGKFVAVDIGSCGGNSDAGVFKPFKLWNTFGGKQTLNSTACSTARNRQYHFAYDTFPQSENIMKPFFQRQLTHENEIINLRTV